MKQKKKEFKVPKGANTVSSWLIIILAYVIIAVGVFNIVVSDSHTLF